MCPYPTSEEVAALDRDDPLGPFRARFVFDDPGRLYLNGNSLGRVPCATVARVAQVVAEEWRAHLVGGWNRAGWWQAPRRLGDLVARVVGAAPGEALLADSTSVNLHKLLVAVLVAEPARRRILVERSNFPSDAHIAHGVAATFAAAGRPLELEFLDVEHDDAPVPRALADAWARDGGGASTLAVLSHVAFRSGFRFDLPAVAAAAREAGARVIWDLSHSAGVVPIDACAAGVELAVGCSYKYLNGGPGAPGWLLVARELLPRLANPLSGWLGHRDPFAMSLDYEPAEGIERFLAGTTPILSAAAVEPALELALEAGIEAAWAKASRQWDFLAACVEERLGPHGVEIATPRRRHGAHLALRLAGAGRAWAWKLALERRGVVADFRPPDLLRVAIAPLYTSWADLAEFVARAEASLRDDLAAAAAAATPPRPGVAT